MLDAPLDLGGAVDVDAAPNGLSCGPHHHLAADGAFFGILKGPAPARPSGIEDPDDLGDDVARAGPDDPVAHPHVLSRYLVLVVKGGP